MLAGKLSQLGLDLNGERLQLDAIGLAASAETNTETAAAVALSLKVVCHWLVTNAVHASAADFTLADGVAGQLCYVVVKTKGTHDAVLTPANFGPGATLTFNAAGESALLVFDGTNWQVVGSWGSPALA